MEESSEEEDEEMEYLVKNFTRFMKSEKEKSKHESKKKKMKEPQRIQSSNKRGSSSKKAYVATWSEEDSTEEEEVAHLCFLALQEGEVTSSSSNSNSYTFDELQDAYGEYRYPRHEYRYPLHQKGSNGWKISPTAPNNSQRSPTARYTIGTIKKASKHLEKANASLINIHMMKICLRA
ncbi:hypothetical protein V6N13_072449 [Hibiscus sabdariffa]